MTQLVAIDWGTSSFRAWLIDGSGTILQQIKTGQGILQVGNGSFENILRENIARLRATENIVIIASGMITSSNGWVETPYLSCPVDISALASGLVCRKWTGPGEIWFIPGVSQRFPEPDIMRGEETQLAGINIEGDAVVVLPGTHSKWVRMTTGKIEAFTSFLTGELFAAITSHTILAETGGMVWSEQDFLRGVFSAADNGGKFLLSRLFQLRANKILNLAAAAGCSYVSGLLIGMEIEDAIERGYNSPVLIAGEKGLVQRYGSAFTARGITVTIVAESSAAKGLYRVARERGLI